MRSGNNVDNVDNVDNSSNYLSAKSRASTDYLSIPSPRYPVRDALKGLDPQAGLIIPEIVEGLYSTMWDDIPTKDHGKIKHVAINLFNESMGRAPRKGEDINNSFYYKAIKSYWAEIDRIKKNKILLNAKKNRNSKPIRTPYEMARINEKNKKYNIDNNRWDTSNYTRQYIKSLGKARAKKRSTHKKKRSTHKKKRSTHKKKRLTHKKKRLTRKKKRSTHKK